MFGFSAPVQSFASLPDELRLFNGQVKHLQWSIPVQAEVTVGDPEIVSMNGTGEWTQAVDPYRPIALQPQKAGTTEMQLRLFGKIPLKTLTVSVVPDLKVIPGGQTIGVKLKSAGILVVGHHLVATEQGGKVSPGEEAQIQVGDLITKIDNVPINDVSKVGRLVEAAGKNNQKMELTVQRNGRTFRTRIMPQYDKEDKAYRLGLYIRDSAAGVGTLTFYAPDQGVYGALGHVITDMDTQTPITVGSGQIIQSNVTSISKSQNGEPGEKKAHFFRESKVLGNIEKNTAFGIFGKMDSLPDNSYFKEAIPVAFAEEVEEGPAQIYTVVNGQRVEQFNIEITHVTRQKSPATKGMVIKITDPKLLEKTGGIVQGMSGSPIVQNGKLVGAVTHVFVNDPTSGYGCFIEWMLQDAGIMLKPNDLKAG
jgi:stage IV sporulation protein B